MTCFLKRAISIGAIVVISLLFVRSAEAHVYWSNNAGTSVGRANLDGTGVNESLVSGGFNPCGVAVDGAHLYWGNIGAGAVGRANLDGSGADQSFIGDEIGPCGVAVDGAHVYWSNGVAGTIGRANLDGTGVNQSLVSGGSNSCGVALDAAHLYWANAGNGTIGRANLDGTGVNQSFIGGANRPCGVAVDADPTGGVQDPGGGGEIITNPPTGGGGGVIPKPPPPGDTAAQLPTLGMIKIAVRHRRLVARVSVLCPTGEAGGCRTGLRLATAKRIRRGKVRASVVLGSKRINLRPGQRLTVSVRLARGAAGFARHGTLASRIRITSSDAAGNSAARSVTRRLTIPRR